MAQNVQKTKMQLQLLIPSHEVMSHFCYAYASALLVKLKELVKEKRYFKDTERALTDHLHDHTITSIGHSVSQELSQQIGCAVNDNVEGVKNLIAIAEEFLVIFQA